MVIAGYAILQIFNFCIIVYVNNYSGGEREMVNFYELSKLFTNHHICL